MGRLRLAVVLTLALLAICEISSISFCSNTSNTVLQVNLTGDIDSATATMMQDALSLATAQNARLVIVTLNTPGGELGAVQTIMNLFDNSSIPVCCYVYPVGATAWSGGTYVLMASHVAAMASGTTIGSCQPVDSTGTPITDTKYLNALTALMVNHAVLHNRNETAAELFVMQNLNLGADSALQNNVVEVLADDVHTLLVKLEGFALAHLTGDSGQRTWKLVPITDAQNYNETQLFSNISNANIISYSPGIQIFLLGLLYNPLVSSLLLIVGIFLFFIGIKTPGHGAEVAGAICIVLAIIGFQAVGVGLGAIVLFAVGAVMIVAELKTHIGALAIGGASCMVIGSLILFPSTQWLLYYQDIQQIQESLVAITLAMAVLFSFIVYKAAQSRRFKIRTGKEPLIGAQGVAIKDLAPEGQVRVLGEFWQARAQEGSISKGQNIRVVRLEGLFLIVKPVEEKA